MAANKVERFGPVALTTTMTTNIVSPATVGSATGYTATASYVILRHIRIVNITATAATFSMWVGGSNNNTAGTEAIGIALSVPANSAFDWYGLLRLNPAQFLVGGSGTAAALTFQAEGEVGLS